MKVPSVVAVLALAAAAVGCSSSPMSPMSPSSMGTTAVTPDTFDGTGVKPEESNGRSALPTIAEIAVGNQNFSMLVAALSKAGLVATFSGDRHYTVFAPTNAAFDTLAQALGFADGPALIAGVNVATLTKILQFHVTRGDRNATSVLAAGSLTMLDGNRATISTSGAGAFIQNAKIVATDIRASNGLIHVIDAVILPPGL